MGLNAKDIQIQLFRMLQVSVEISYTYMKKHPLVGGALSILFIMYIFLSYIYNLVVFLSPFLVCTAILVRIFWSSEQTQLRCVPKKREKEKVEPKKQLKMLKHERRGFLYKCPSQNATSRRRNFTRKRLDVYGGLEEQAKDLSEVFRNEFTNRNIDLRRAKFFETEMDILDYKFAGKKLEAPAKHVLFSEPSMVDLVTCDASCEGTEKKIGKLEDERKAEEDGMKELLGDDQKNQMDLGDCEVERSKRLESLIARRRARKQLKLQLEKSIIKMKSVKPDIIAPLFVTRVNPFDSPREFEGVDGIEMPGSAPSTLRSPFDLPYDSFEEKPNLTGDSFNIEFKSKDMSLEPRQDPNARKKGVAHPRVIMLPGKGNHDNPISNEQPISNESSENEKAPSPPSEEEETTHEEDEKYKIYVAGMKGEEVHNADAAEPMLVHTNNSNLVPIITPNVESVGVSEKQGPSTSNTRESVLDFPTSINIATNINDSLYESLSTPDGKNKENMSFNGRSICHTPSCSLASDLQVEVSEAGSPRLTFDESHEFIATTDGESSMVSDGDIDKDVISGSEDMWGASLHSREVHGTSEHDNVLEANNWRDFGSPMSLQNIDEENVADVGSMSSRSGMLEDDPTHAASSDHNIFGNMKDYVGENGVPKPSQSSDVLSRWRRLMQLMDTQDNHLPHTSNSEKPEEWCNESENLPNKAQVTNDVNNPEATKQDNTQDTRSNEDHDASVVRQEATDEISINSSSSSSSPRSVLLRPQKNVEGEVSSSAHNQEIHLGVQQSNMEDMVQETLNGEAPPHDSLPQSNSQEPNMSSKMNGAEICSKEDEIMLKNDEINEDKFNPLNIQDASAEPPGLAGMISSDDMNEKSRELFDEKVPLISLMLESSSQIQRENEEKNQASVRQEATTEPFINAEATDTSFANDFEGKLNDLNENETMLSSCIPEEESDKLSEKNKEDNFSEVNYLQSESEQEVKDHIEKGDLEKCSISKDSPLPIATEVTNNIEDIVGESDMMNTKETTLSCISVEESDKLSVKNKENHCSEEVNYLQSESKQEVKDHIEKESLDKGGISEESPLPMATEVTNNVEDIIGESNKKNKNEVTDQEFNNNHETMVLSKPEREVDHVRNIAPE